MLFERICNAFDHYYVLFKYKTMYKNKLKIGKGVRFRGKSRISISTNAEIVIGNRVFINNDCSINSRESIIIGNNTIIGESEKSTIITIDLIEI